MFAFFLSTILHTKSSATSRVLEVYSSLRNGLLLSQPKQSSGWPESEFIARGGDWIPEHHSISIPAMGDFDLEMRRYAGEKMTL
jgi:hypothetical protein